MSVIFYPASTLASIAFAALLEEGIAPMDVGGVLGLLEEFSASNFSAFHARYHDQPWFEAETKGTGPCGIGKRGIALAMRAFFDGGVKSRSYEGILEDVSLMRCNCTDLHPRVEAFLEVLEACLLQRKARDGAKHG